MDGAKVSIDTSVLAKIIEQANKISDDCEYSSASNFELGRVWDIWNNTLGISSTILSSVAAYFAVTEEQSSITIFASMAATVFAAVLTFLKPSEKASAYREFGNRYRSLRNKARVFSSIDCLQDNEYESLRKKLDKIMIEKEELNLGNPVIPRWAFRSAQKSLDEKRSRKASTQTGK